MAAKVSLLFTCCDVIKGLTVFVVKDETKYCVAMFSYTAESDDDITVE